ncbi:uncharacterized protein BDZ99DRAFT_383628 [Mytilinidion resinicola]|uniref:Uncharacterized protein n=1 Tax=Mytilinidion resinicola TaxID=574789 RepID=A0A6A6YUR8_9PEZI|nr:uncharacterized protein BDZ99DRAFT_383628 [Mytilinidion resinicola]KAF2812521.1 hypothetical protein BDZ99DRAFT_383628 [Mytilinidion resinicola]
MATTHPPTTLQVAEQLADGFIALSGEYQLLADQHRELESKLLWAKQQYLDLLKRFSPTTAAAEHRAFLQDLEQPASVPLVPRPDWLAQLSTHDDGERRTRAYIIRQASISAEQIRANSDDEVGVKIWNGPSADRESASVSAPSRSHMDSTLGLERDFTIPGTPSRLGCPFAATPSGRRVSTSGRQSPLGGSPLATPRSSMSMSRIMQHGRRSKRPSFHDPIRAEICGIDSHVDPVSGAESVASGSAPVCPIRFLDQHSPEEVAKYFENHKHEIPRSHEVCVKRFQSNTESIKQLDAKYGNLVSMIQGLGVKHQPWLPKEPEEDEDEAIERQSGDRVEKWAKAVSESLHDEDEAIADTHVDEVNIPDDMDRTPHFDRPLKEIRVGESPSRPWGISVPSKYHRNKADSVASSERDKSATASPLSQPKFNMGMASEMPADMPAKPSGGGCPFDHTRMTMGVPQTPHVAPPETPHPQILPEQPQQQDPFVPPPTSPAPESSEANKPTPQPQVIFNGPVFIGYAPEQIMAFLAQGGGLGNGIGKT